MLDPKRPSLNNNAMERPNPIIVAIDTTDAEQALALAASLKGSVGAIKLGLEFFTANGAAGVRELEKAGLPIFLDLKFHDIPNTVAGAIRGLGKLNIFLTTIHTSGGAAMMQAAKEAALQLPSKPMVVGVTILTCLDNKDMGEIGYRQEAAAQALQLAKLAKSSGLDGIVCSPHEVAAIRKECGKDFVLVVPGIRPAGSDKGDQKRVMTPKEAMDAGASYLVIGRPITEAPDPKAAAGRILGTLNDDQRDLSLLS